MCLITLIIVSFSLIEEKYVIEAIRTMGKIVVFFNKIAVSKKFQNCTVKDYNWKLATRILGTFLLCCFLEYFYS